MTYYTHLESGQRKARKRHVCDLCLQPIERGWTYDYETAISDVGPFTSKAHPACLVIYRQWDRDDQEDFEAVDYVADGYAWPKYGPDGAVIEPHDPEKCWRCSRCGQRGTYAETLYGLCRQCKMQEEGSNEHA